MRGSAAGVMVAALFLTSCGSDGPKTLSKSDFVDELNAICKRAGRDLGRLDPGDRTFFDDALDILSSSSDDLAELRPPKALANDFEDFSADLDDTISETENLQKAVEDEDSDAITKSSNKLTRINDDSNDIADSLGAEDCVDVGGSTADTIPDTTPDTSSPDTSSPDTSSPDTSTPGTPLPIDSDPPTTVSIPPVTVPATTRPPTTTAAPTTMPPMTSPAGGGDGRALDASQEWAAPAGFTWGALDLTEVGTPFDDPVLGPVLTSYWAGLLENATTGQQALVYITELNTPSGTPWTDAQLNAIFDFEGVLSGTDTTTPGGLPARVNLNVGDTTKYDIGLFYLPRNSVSMITPTGTDVVGTLDAFFTANSMG